MPANSARTPASATVPETIPMTFSNNSGRSDRIYIYNIGTLSGHQGWADAKGGFHLWRQGEEPPRVACDASITGPVNGKSMTILVPKLSGRIYFSYRRKLVFKLSLDGLIEPSIDNQHDPNWSILFNYVEYTLNDTGLSINSTQVDMFSAPYSVAATSADGTTTSAGKLKKGGYRSFFRELANRRDCWAKLIQKDANDTILRALSAGHGITTGALPKEYMDDYVNDVWARYATSALIVTPVPYKGSYYGHVSGDVMCFTDGSRNLVTRFKKPGADSIFGCCNRLDEPNDKIRGPISRTLCAAYNRTTLLTHHIQPDKTSADFYHGAVTNHYARLVHMSMLDGKAYAFPSDDVGDFASFVKVPDPTSASITFEPFD